MGFIRQQEENLAVRLLKWHYQRNNWHLPEEDTLKRLAGGIVDEAHRIAKERGRNVFSIIKETISDLKK